MTCKGKGQKMKLDTLKVATIRQFQEFEFFTKC